MPVVLVLGLGQLGLVWSFVIGRGKARAGHFSAPLCLRSTRAGAAAPAAPWRRRPCSSIDSLIAVSIIGVGRQEERRREGGGQEWKKKRKKFVEKLIQNHQCQ
jgi:hypothetical protein